MGWVPSADFCFNLDNKRGESGLQYVNGSGGEWVGLRTAEAHGDCLGWWVAGKV